MCEEKHIFNELFNNILIVNYLRKSLGEFTAKSDLTVYWWSTILAMEFSHALKLHVIGIFVT